MTNIKQEAIVFLFGGDIGDLDHVPAMITGNYISFPPDVENALNFVLKGYKKYYNIKYMDTDEIPDYDEDEDEAIERYLKRYKWLTKYSAIFLHTNMDNLMFILFTPEIENIIINKLGLCLEFIYEAINDSGFVRLK